MIPNEALFRCVWDAFQRSSRRGEGWAKRLAYGKTLWIPVMGLMLASAGVQADNLRTQTVPLKAGWNAVFLEVEPVDSAPEKVLARTPVDIVASFYDPGVSPQFVSNPGGNLFREAGWGTWYAESRPDAFLKSLYAMYGQRAYLIHATNDCSFSVKGSVVPAKVRWTPDSYNFVGFSVSSSAPPTFDQFFSGSPALRHNKIYRLVNGAWRQVTDPTSETLRSGEAFWIFCSGASTYQGPLSVGITTLQGLILGSGGDSIVLRNETSHPVTPVLDHVASGADAVPLLIVVQALSGATSAIQSMGVPKPAGDWSLSLPTLEAGASLRVPLEAKVESMTLPVHQSLLKISTDMGTESWIPVIGVRADMGAK